MALHLRGPLLITHGHGGIRKYLGGGVPDISEEPMKKYHIIGIDLNGNTWNCSFDVEFIAFSVAIKCNNSPLGHILFACRKENWWPVAL